MSIGRRLREYISSLPNGLGSYPWAQTKTTVALNAMGNQDPCELAEGAPDELASLILNPPPLGVWMPATYSDAIFHLVCDKHYPSEELMKEWCYRRTKALGDNPLYAAIFRVSGPRAFFALSTRTHRLFQRGSKMEVIASTKNGVRIGMTFPARLHNRFNLLSNEPLFRGLAELSGGRHVTCRLVKVAATTAQYDCSWS